MVLNRLKKALSGSPSQEEYLEIDLEQEQEKKNKIMVKLFSLKKYEDINNILGALREGYTIAIVDFKVLKQKDPIELKRAISKIKKTIEALEGSIAGHENLIIATPSFAKIYREEPVVVEKKEKYSDF